MVNIMENTTVITERNRGECMKQKIITIALIISCIILGLIALIIKTTHDTKPPIITVGNEKLTYTQGEDFSILLRDVKAQDNKDKDLSDQVFVERIIDMDNSQQATVIYAVLDSSKNVATAKRIVNYIKVSEEQMTTENTTDTINASPNVGVSQQETTAQELPILVANGESPLIQLTTNTMTIAVGQAVDLSTVVHDVVDNKDTREQLFQHIHIDGIYDINVAGTYVLQYYVTDQENNPSNIEAFTLIVQ